MRQASIILTLQFQQEGVSIRLSPCRKIKDQQIPKTESPLIRSVITLRRHFPEQMAQPETPIPFSSMGNNQLSFDEHAEQRLHVRKTLKLRLWVNILNGN